MKQKYIEERFPRYFIFGEDEKGNVYVSQHNKDIVSHVSVPEAEFLIKERDRILNMLIALAQALDEENSDVFKQIWYDADY